MIQLTADDTAALLELRKVSKRKSDLIRRRDRVIADLREELRVLQHEFNRTQARREETTRRLREMNLLHAELVNECASLKKDLELANLLTGQLTLEKGRSVEIHNSLLRQIKMLTVRVYELGIAAGMAIGAYLWVAL